MCYKLFFLKWKGAKLNILMCNRTKKLQFPTELMSSYDVIVGSSSILQTGLSETIWTQLSTQDTERKLSWLVRTQASWNPPPEDKNTRVLGCHEMIRSWSHSFRWERELTWLTISCGDIHDHCPNSGFSVPLPKRLTSSSFPLNFNRNLKLRV